MVDPEFWLDEDITSLAYEYRLFYIGTWNFSDDYGVVENSAKKLKAQIFPYDDVDCEKILEKLIKIKKLIPFEADGKQWLFIKKFLKYQRVDKPSRNRNPQAPKELLDEDYPTTPEPLLDEVKLSKVKLSKKKRKKENIILPDWLNKKAWEAWVQHREEINKPLTDGAIKLALKKLEENQKDHVQMIKNSIMGRWTGLFPINKENKTNSDYKKRVSEDEEKREKKENEKTNDKLRILSEQSKSLADKMSV